MAKKKRSGSRSNSAKRSYRHKPLKNRPPVRISSRQLQNIQDLLKVASTLAPSQLPNASRFGTIRRTRRNAPSTPYKKPISTTHSALRGGVVRGGNASPTLRSAQSTIKAKSVISDIQPKKDARHAVHKCRERPDPNKPAPGGGSKSPNFIPWKGTSKC